MGFFIPETMKKLDNWVVWRKRGEGHGKKVPYDPRSGRLANPTKSCCCYDDAVAYYSYGNDYDGVGFTFTKDCGLTFIDLDNCISEDGSESALAREVQELFKESYIEISQSERGLHIICMGTVPKTIKTKEIEIYSAGRYVALTGNALCFNEPQPAQDKLELLYERYKGCVEEVADIYTTTFDTDNTTYSTDIESLIKVIQHSRHGSKWSRLHNGDISGYPSRSEAMLAYVSITNYYAGGRTALIKEIFFKSRFPADDRKYKKDYYIERAIRKAQEPFTVKRNITNKRTVTDNREIHRKRF